MKPFIIMRSYNDIDVIEHTLKALYKQNMPFELLVLDNESNDGTREIVDKYTDNVINIPRGEYIPGKVLNEGMRSSSGEIVVFLNSDCTPESNDWLENLVNGFVSHDIAAVFGAQLPRNNCHPVHAKDILDTFGNGLNQSSWNHCFSMAASAIRRSVWNIYNFSDELQYSEDIDWTWKLRVMGYKIKYIPEARVYHSHNYTLQQCYKRQYGEGLAEATIFTWSRWQRSFPRYVLMPYCKRIIKDCFYLISTFNFRHLAMSPLIRAAQLYGRWSGFKNGIKEVSPC
jgi:GT2 family glycosyltransferase